MASITISGGEALEAKLKEIARKVANAATVRVGFLEDATYADGTSVATIAAIQNFGAPARGIPPRPFFSDMVEKESPGWGDSFATILTDTGYDVQTSLGLMGAEIEGQLRQSIVDTNAPANSPVTLLLKDRFPHREGMTFADVLQARRDVAAGIVAGGSNSNPLVWSGVMLQSVSSEVVGGAPA